MKFEQLALVCTWVIDQLRNESLELKKKFVILSIHSKKLIQISFEFGFSSFMVCLNHLIDA
jgi:hypothetical protein